MKAITSFVRRLREDPEFREEVRRQVLTDELLALPELVRHLLDLQRQTLEVVREMAARMSAFVEAVNARLDRVEGRLETDVTQLMLDPEDYRVVRRLAEAQGRSISDVIRELIRRGLQALEDERTRRLRALQALADLRRRQAMAPPDLPASVREDLRRRTVP